MKARFKAFLPVFLSASAVDANVISKAKALVRYYYWILFALALLSSFTFFSKPSDTTMFSPLWPIALVRSIPVTALATAYTIGFLLSSAISALVPFSVLARVGAFTGLFLYHAFISSFHQVINQWSPWVYTAFLFIFLPRQTNQKSQSESFLTIVWGAQAWFLLLYSMAGFWKITSMLDQLLHGNTAVIGSNILALQIVSTWIIALGTGPLAQFFVDHLWPGWILYMSAIYLQIFALWAAYKPALHRIWGAGLILFHVGTYLIFGIDFWLHIVLAILLLLGSPFVPHRINFGLIAADLPIFRFLFALLRRQKPAG